VQPSNTSLLAATYKKKSSFSRQGEGKGDGSKSTKKSVGEGVTKRRGASGSLRKKRQKKRTTQSKTNEGGDSPIRLISYKVRRRRQKIKKRGGEGVQWEGSARMGRKKAKAHCEPCREPEQRSSALHMGAKQGPMRKSGEE